MKALRHWSYLWWRAIQLHCTCLDHRFAIMHWEWFEWVIGLMRWAHKQRLPMESVNPSSLIFEFTFCKFIQNLWTTSEFGFNSNRDITETYGWVAGWGPWQCSCRDPGGVKPIRPSPQPWELQPMGEECWVMSLKLQTRLIYNDFWRESHRLSLVGSLF